MFAPCLKKGYSLQHLQILHILLGLLKPLTTTRRKLSMVGALQLSVLRVFERLLADPAFRTRRSAHEVLHFAAGVVRNLLARLGDADAPTAARMAACAASGGDSGGTLVMSSGLPCGTACLMCCVALCFKLPCAKRRALVLRCAGECPRLLDSAALQPLPGENFCLR